MLWEDPRSLDELGKEGSDCPGRVKEMSPKGQSEGHEEPGKGHLD